MQQPESKKIDSFEIRERAIGPTIHLNLPVFEGPMDLLLYLIRREEIDVFDIPVAHVTEEYLRHLDLMNAGNLEIGGEFLVMAATLLAIKARMLLPRQIETEDDVVGADPRHDLVERILEYKAFKESAYLFRQLEEGQSGRFQRQSAPVGVDTDAFVIERALRDVSLFDLLTAFKLAMDRFSAEEPRYNVNLLPETIDQKIDELRSRLQESSKISFTALLKDQKTRLAVILIFLAILELVRIGEIGLKGVSEHDFIIVLKAV
ncbi:segregation/condensation protein A [bacterium]|nr:segregation/condensation protein A [bacterium]MBU1652261.1 segregation/condensation protein A [bacterium]MBU1882202.1 segregation/condensation protein A [bacterium]